MSVLSFGSWVSFGPQLAGGSARDCLAAAYDAGVNFFDNAEVYAGGRSETIMGEAIAELGWPRHTYVISSKFFWGIEDSVNTRNTLNRKYLFHAVDGSLRRLGLDFLDLIFCHRPDPDTPDRGDGAGDARHHHLGQGPLLGNVGVERRGDPRGVGHRRSPPPAQARDGAAPVQPLRA